MAAGQAVVLLSSPLVTRLFDPSAFGVFAVLTAIESVFVVMACLRLEMAVTLPAEDRDAANVVAAGLMALAGVTFLLGILSLVSGSLLATWTAAPGLERYLWLVPAVVFFDAAGTLFSFWSVRRRRFGEVAVSRIGQSAFQAGGQIGLGYLAGSAAGLMVGVGIGRAASAGVVAIAALRKDWAAFRSVTWAGARSMIRRYRRFPLIGAPSSLLNALGQQLPALLLAGLYGIEVAGWYLLGSRMVALPSLVLGQAVSQAFHGHVSELHRSDPQSVRSESRGLVLRLVKIGLAPTVVFVVAGPWLFGLVFGSAWETAGQYVQVLAVAYLVQFAVSPVASLLAVTERNDLQFAWDLGRLVLIAGALVVPAALGVGALGTVGVLAAASTAAYVALYPLAGRALKHPHHATQS